MKVDVEAACGHVCHRQHRRPQQPPSLHPRLHPASQKQHVACNLRPVADIRSRECLRQVSSGRYTHGRAVQERPSPSGRREQFVVHRVEHYPGQGNALPCADSHRHAPEGQLRRIVVRAINRVHRPQQAKASSRVYCLCGCARVPAPLLAFARGKCPALFRQYMVVGVVRPDHLHGHLLCRRVILSDDVLAPFGAHLHRPPEAVERHRPRGPCGLHGHVQQPGVGTGGIGQRLRQHVSGFTHAGHPLRSGRGGGNRFNRQGQLLLVGDGRWLLNTG